MNDQLLTIKDLCRELAIGKNTAYELCRKKKINAIRLGRRFIIRKRDLDRYIDKMMDDETL